MADTGSAEIGRAAGQRLSDGASVRIEGHKVALRQFGAGTRPLLALHCSLAHGGAWAPLAGALPGARITAPDMPGHGESDPPGDADFHRLSTDVAARLAEEAGAQAGVPVDLIGHSYGATVALRLALERPELVRSLTLCEPVLFAAAEGTEAFEATLLQQNQVADLQQHDAGAAAAVFHGAWGGGIPFAALPARQRDYMAARMYLVTGLRPVLLDDVARLLAPGRLEALPMPVLLTEGGASPPVIAAIHDRLAARIPGARRASIAGAGHMMPITHPAELARAISPLLAAS